MTTYWLKLASVPLAALAAVYVLLFALLTHAWWALGLGAPLVMFVLGATFARWPTKPIGVRRCPACKRPVFDHAAREARTCLTRLGL